VTTLNFKSGRVGKVASVIDCWQPYYFHTHLVGSEGSLLDNRFHSNRLHGLNRSAWSQLSFKPVDSGDVSDHPYQTQFQASSTRWPAARTCRTPRSPTRPVPTRSSSRRTSRRQRAGR